MYFLLFGENIMEKNCSLKLITHFFPLPLSTDQDFQLCYSVLTTCTTLNTLLARFQNGKQKAPHFYCNCPISFIVVFCYIDFTSIYLGKHSNHIATTLMCFEALQLTILLVLYLQSYLLYTRNMILFNEIMSNFKFCI